MHARVVCTHPCTHGYGWWGEGTEDPTLQTGTRVGGGGGLRARLAEGPQARQAALAHLPRRCQEAGLEGPCRCPLGPWALPLPIARPDPKGPTRPETQGLTACPGLPARGRQCLVAWASGPGQGWVVPPRRPSWIRRTLTCHSADAWPRFEAQLPTLATPAPQTGPAQPAHLRRSTSSGPTRGLPQPSTVSASPGPPVRGSQPDRQPPVPATVSCGDHPGLGVS